MKTCTKILLSVLFSIGCSFAQPITEFNTREEAHAKIVSMEPKEEAFAFKKPQGWEAVSLSSAIVVKVNEGEDLAEAQKIIDSNTGTTWQTKSYNRKPEVIIDLGSLKKFNRIVIYNRCTYQRGTGGGNNALKDVAISCANDANSTFKSVGSFELSGPIPFCVKIKGGGQMCTFIDNTEPSILEIPTTETRYLKLNFVEAYWGEYSEPEWKSSIALTEVMLFEKE